MNTSFKQLLSLALLSLLSLSNADMTFAQVLLTKKKALLYPIEEKQTASNIIQPVTKPIELNKGEQLDFLNCTHSKKGFYYDSYIIRYQGKPYVISSGDVLDNSVLLSENEQLYKLKVSLQEVVSAYQAHIEGLESSYPSRKQARLDAIAHQIDSVKAELSVLEKKAEAQADSLDRIIAIQDLEEGEKFLSTLPQKLKLLSERIVIKECYLEEPNTASGCDFSFYYTNKSSKTIKYLTWQGKVYNNVGDAVPCTITNKTLFSGKDTGPYSSNETNCGGVWECILYNWSASRIVLTSIVIDYMDGTSYSIAFQKGEFEQFMRYSSIVGRTSNQNNIHLVHRNEALSNLGHDKLIKQLDVLDRRLSSERQNEGYSDPEIRDAKVKLIKLQRIMGEFPYTGDKNEAENAIKATGLLF